MKITILVDNPDSWSLPYVEQLIAQLRPAHSVSLVHKQQEIEPGDVAIFLSCEKLVKGDILKRNKYNLVAHASPLPEGKGFSPLAWQILEGKNEITVSLFDAVEEVDAGVIYDQAVLQFSGHELVDDMRAVLGQKITELIINFLNRLPEVSGVQISGPGSFYRRRGKEDSELDPEKTIAAQFNLLRIVDNERYPAFFNYRGHKFILKIYKAD